MMALNRGYKQSIADATARVRTLSVAEARRSSATRALFSSTSARRASLSARARSPEPSTRPAACWNSGWTPKAPTTSRSSTPQTARSLLRVGLAFRACGGNLARDGPALRQPYRRRLLGLEKSRRPNSGVAEEGLTGTGGRGFVTSPFPICATQRSPRPRCARRWTSCPIPRAGIIASCGGIGRKRAEGRASAILFLLAAGERSHWHRVDASEIWIWQAGAPLAWGFAILAESGGRSGSALTPERRSLSKALCRRMPGRRPKAQAPGRS